MQRDAKRETVSTFRNRYRVRCIQSHFSAIHTTVRQSRADNVVRASKRKAEINWRVRANALSEFVAHDGIQRTGLQSEIASQASERFT